jgi:hypothetical protein
MITKGEGSVDKLWGEGHFLKSVWPGEEAACKAVVTSSGLEIAPCSTTAMYFAMRVIEAAAVFIRLAPLSSLIEVQAAVK